MGLNADFPAEVGVEIPEDFEQTTGRKIFYIVRNGTNMPEANVPGNFRPRGITIDYQRSDRTSNYAMVRGKLWSEATFKTRRLAVGVTHPRAYKEIDVEGSDALGIEINA